MAGYRRLCAAFFDDAGFTATFIVSFSITAVYAINGLLDLVTQNPVPDPGPAAAIPFLLILLAFMVLVRYTAIRRRAHDR